MHPVSPSYSDRPLQETPADVTRLLHAMGPVPEFRDMMRPAGNRRRHHRGPRVAPHPTGRPCGQQARPRRRSAAGATSRDDRAGRWDEPGFARLEAALDRHFRWPGQHEFDNPATLCGVEAGQGVASFLAQVEHLDEGTDPARSHANRKKGVSPWLPCRGLPEADPGQALRSFALGCNTFALVREPSPSIATASFRIVSALPSGAAPRLVRKYPKYKEREDLPAERQGSHTSAKHFRGAASLRGQPPRLSRARRGLDSVALCRTVLPEPDGQGAARPPLAPPPSHVLHRPSMQAVPSSDYPTACCPSSTACTVTAACHPGQSPSRSASETVWSRAGMAP